MIFAFSAWGGILILQALKFLASDEGEKEVLDMIADTARKGITGVPFTIIDGKWAVSGGQTTEVFCQVRRAYFNASAVL